MFNVFPRRPRPNRVCRKLQTCCIPLAVGILLLATATCGHANPPEYVPDEVLVKWTAKIQAADAAAARDRVAGITLRKYLNGEWERLRIDPGLDVPKALQRLRQLPGVLAAEPNYLRHVHGTVPDDTAFPLQWALRNTGQTVNGVAGTAGADISATGAWEMRSTSAAIVIAMLDTGVLTTHADLVPNLVTGWNFVANSADVTDDNGHGTFVAGIIGAKGNDHNGIAGVTWSTQLMPLKVCDATGSCTSADVVSGIQYAASHGAHIINASIAGGGFSQFEKDAIDAFAGLVVAAAGNGASGNPGTNNDTTPLYPACYTSPNVIAVASTDQNDALATTSNFGTGCVPLAAPGENIYSDYNTGELGIGSGTSFSAPMVSGVAALMKAQEPNRTTADIRAALLSTVDVKPGLAGFVGTGGRLNARAAVTAMVPIAPSGLTATLNTAGQIELAWTDNSAGESGYQVERKTGEVSYTVFPTLPANSTTYTDTGASANQLNTYRVRAINSSGASDYSLEVAVAGLSTIASAQSSESGGSSGGGKGCFIATAAYGSPLSVEVQALRDVRDRFLLTTAPGRLFVRVYYRLSPPLARGIARREWLRTLVRAGLRPVVAWAHLALTAPGAAFAILLVGFPGAALSLAFVIIRRRFGRP